jgi:hypothetical protein
MSLLAPSDGTLRVAVWPTYVGVCQQDPGPGAVPYGEPQGTEYQRGQITWGMERGEIIGRAQIHAGAGMYTHLAYFHGPEGPHMCGKVQLSHPIRLSRATMITVHPITNPDGHLLKAQGCL